MANNKKVNQDERSNELKRRADLEKLTTSEDSHADVTGGMGGKIETIKYISKKGIDTVLLNGNKPDRLYKVLIGEDTKSTIVYGDKK